MHGLLFIFLGLVACSDPPVHKGKVTDRWGKPIAGVTIGLTGTAKQMVSGADGKFTIPVQQKEIKIRAGKPGYIKKSMKMSPFSGEGKPNPLLIAMYPDPEKVGFYAVTSSEYAELESKLVKTVGTDIRAFNGLLDVGKIRLNGKKPLEFVFSSEDALIVIKKLFVCKTENQKSKYVRK